MFGKIGRLCTSALRAIQLRTKRKAQTELQSQIERAPHMGDEAQPVPVTYGDVFAPGGTLAERADDVIGDIIDQFFREPSPLQRAVITDPPLNPVVHQSFESIVTPEQAARELQRSLRMAGDPSSVVSANMEAMGRALRFPASQIVQVKGRGSDVAKKEQPVKGRKVWLEDERPSVVAARLKREEKERKEQARLKQEQALREKAEATKAALEKERADYVDGLRKRKNAAEKMADGDLRAIEIFDSLPVKVVSRNIVTAQITRVDDKDVTSTFLQFSLPKAPEGYEYYLLDQSAEITQDRGNRRRDRVKCGVLPAELRHRVGEQEIDVANIVTFAEQVQPLPLDVIMATRAHLPRQLGRRVGSLVLIPNDVSGSLRSRAWSHDALNTVLSMPSLSDWKTPEGPIVNYLQGRRYPDRNSLARAVLTLGL